MSKIKQMALKAINLKAIAEKYNLEAKEIGPKLFPNHAFPKHAWKRVLDGESHLDALQISKLASLLGVKEGDLFEDSDWGLKSVKDTLIITNGEYEAVLDMETLTTKVYKNNSLFHTTILHGSAITLTEYTEFIKTIIKNN